MDYKELWINILKQIEPEITRANLLAWFRCSALLNYEDRVLTIGSPFLICVDWIKKHYLDLILQQAKLVLSDLEKIEIHTDLTLDSENHRTIDLLAHFPNKKKQRKLPNKNEIKLEGGVISKILNDRYRLSNYIVGNDNRLAYAACLAVARKPGANYNPLFIYGGVGLGKTHLLQGVGNEILKNFPDKTVAYLTSEAFTNEVVDAIKKKSVEFLRRKYRQVDALIIDDIQFIAHKDRTQEEFFHTFNALYQDGKQIVVSSDRPPAELDILEERLKSRFSMGMIVDVSMPDYETRLAILHSKARDKEVFLSSEVLEFIAYNIKGNVRELEGVLNQAIALYDLENITPTIKSVTKIFQSIKKDHQIISFIEEDKDSKYIKTFDELIDIVCDYYNVPRSAVIGVSRLREYTVPRQVAMYLGKAKMKLAMTKIGEMFSRDHTSVLHAVRKMEKELRNNRQVIRDVNSIKEEAGLN
jgi:chromosomal replication initiator protein